MSKHDHTRKRQAEVKSPSVSEDNRAVPRASGIAEGHHSEVTKGPEPADYAEGRPAPTHEEIAVRAYEIWQASGRPAGDGRGDWFESERQLRDGGPVIDTGPGHAAPIETTEPGGSPAPDPRPRAGIDRGGKPRRTSEASAEQTREAHESEEARQAGPSNRERMVDIGRGNQQASRRGV